MFNKKKYKESLPDGDLRKTYVEYPTKGILAEIFDWVHHIYEDTCYIKAVAEMRNHCSAEIKELKEQIELKDSQIKSLERQCDRSLKTQDFLIDCLKKEYSDGLFIASNYKASKNMVGSTPVVIIQNGKSIGDNASHVSVSWDYYECIPTVAVEYSEPDTKG